MFYGGISSTLSNCKHLRILDLSFNDLWGDIPKEIGNLTKLKELFLDFNILQRAHDLSLLYIYINFLSSLAWYFTLTNDAQS